MDDVDLLARAEKALTEIKVNHGLSDQHASVLAAWVVKSGDPMIVRERAYLYAIKMIARLTGRLKE